MGGERERERERECVCVWDVGVWVAFTQEMIKANCVYFTFEGRWVVNIRHKHCKEMSCQRLEKKSVEQRTQAEIKQRHKSWRSKRRLHGHPFSDLLLA